MKKWAIIIGIVIAYKLIGARQLLGADIRQYIQGVKQHHTELSYIPESLVVAICKTESNFDRTATGAAGEYGLMQIMPDTYTWIGNLYGLGLPASSAYHPYYNILAGMYFLHYLHGHLGNWFDVIHAYNIGLSGFNQGRRNAVYFAKVNSWWAVA